MKDCLQTNCLTFYQNDITPIPPTKLSHSPEKVTDALWVFPPNLNSDGSTAWLLRCEKELLLIDCPPLTKETFDFLQMFSDALVARVVLTSREGHGNIKALQEVLGWPVLVQEQEAYLLPSVSPLESFSEEFLTPDGVRLLWTPGPTPGSCVLHAPSPWNVLFCGRLLSPVAIDHFAPLVNQRTFHRIWYQKSLKKLRHWLPPDAMPSLASGGSLGPLREQKIAPFESWRERV